MSALGSIAGDLYAASIDIPASPAARSALVAAVLPLYLLNTTVAAMQPQPSARPTPPLAPEYQPASTPDDDGALLKWEVTMHPESPALAQLVETINDMEFGGSLTVEIRARRDAKGRAIGLGLWVFPASVGDLPSDAQLDAFHAADGADVSDAEQKADDENAYVQELVRQYGRGRAA